MKRSHVATAAMVNDNGSNRNSEAALAVAGYSPPLDVNGNGNGNGKPPKKRIIDSVIAGMFCCFVVLFAVLYCIVYVGCVEPVSVPVLHVACFVGFTSYKYSSIAYCVKLYYELE